MLPPPALLILIPLPALLAALLGLRASWVTVAGLMGSTAYMLVAVFWPSGPTPLGADAYYVVGFVAFVRTLVIIAFVLMVAQVVKERLGREDRLTTNTLYLMVLIGGAASLLPFTFPPDRRGGWAQVVAEIGAYVLLAGLAGLVLTIILRPLIRRIRRAA
ncbi:hypothetical protein [Maritimibacter sp. UBA3975]|uniref:hypothetical protein n=1 Tax=Maritimibacter sp. UBA3975 TaxID=1946833 RepID=UPI000C09588E|nr:hypothetical protein [Maritimibacter sp. UBA3975]MAM62608.1 hypothetical protein [Maritimibacter sp.]